MTVTYHVGEEDYLEHQLFIASISDRIKKKRLRAKILWPSLYIIFGLLFARDENIQPAVVFTTLGVLWFFLYPIWEKHHFRRHYQAFIKENYKDRFHKIISVEVTDNFILTSDDGSESKISTAEIEEINEIPSNIFIRFKGGQSLILPKNKISDIESIKTRLKNLALSLNIKYVIDNQWKWK